MSLGRPKESHSREAGRLHSDHSHAIWASRTLLYQVVHLLGNPRQLSVSFVDGPSVSGRSNGMSSSVGRIEYILSIGQNI
jgi:hypothetical protein